MTSPNLPPNITTRPIYRRSIWDRYGPLILVIGIYALIILLQLAFWGGVIYVAMHFIHKWW